MMESIIEFSYLCFLSEEVFIVNKTSAMAESFSFLKHLGSKRKTGNTFKEMNNKKSKQSQYEFIIVKLKKCHTEFSFLNTPNQ